MNRSWVVISVALLAADSLARIDDGALRPLESAVQAPTSRGRVRDDLLIALRQLRDPALKPLFASLASSEHAGLRRHGVLGLAEVEAPPRINTLMLSKVQDARELAVLLGEASAADLIGPEQIGGILAWPRLDPYIELVLRGRLAAAGTPLDAKRTEEVIGAASPQNKLVGALLLADAGKPELLAPAIQELIAKEDPARGALVGALLEHIRRERPAHAGPLLARIAEAYDTDVALHADVLRTWLSAQPKEAASAWTKTYDGAASLSDKLRLLLAALDNAGKLPPEMFDAALREQDQPLILAMARAGRALASKQEAPAALAALIALDYKQTELWAADAAERWEAPLASAVRRAILDHALARASVSMPVSEAVPAAAAGLADDKVHLGAVLAEAAERDDEKLVQALLVGVLRARAEPVWDMAHPPKWPDRSSEALALLIEARASDSFARDAEKMKRLSTVAQGLSGNLPEGMRAQAAWLLARHEGQGDVVLAKVLGK